MNSIKVSISCITYNHAGYIRQALDSFLMQRADFKFEILIHDDASTDGTTEIIKEYESKYPDIIKPIYQKENQYSKGARGISKKFNFPRAKGKYIALCEGDDFWTDETKLQRQVDFLEKKEDHSMVFHPVEVFFEYGKTDNHIFPEEKKGFTIEGLLQRNFIQTNSVLFRNRDFSKMKEDIMPSDWYLHLFNAQFGKIGFIDRVMSKYRRHSGGVWAVEQSDVWLKYGLDHLKLYKELLDIYKKPSQEEIITENAVLAVSGLVESSRDEDYKNSDLYPYFSYFTPKAIKSLNNRIKEKDFNIIKTQDDLNKVSSDLNKAKINIDILQKEIDSIKKSNIYRLLNRISNLIRKFKNIFSYNR